METLNEGKPAAATAGALLKQARQQRGMHIAALAVTLKVPQAKLEAVEADRWSDLPDATFARALATAMARALKLEAAQVLALMPAGERTLHVPPGLNQPYRERVAGMVEGSPWLARPVVWGVAVSLLAAAGIYWFPKGWLPEREAPADAAPATFVNAPLAPIAGSPASQVATPRTTPAQPVIAAGTAPVAAEAPMVASPVASAPLQVLPASAPVVLQVAATSALHVRAGADSWIEVVDAKGQVLLSRVLRRGEEQDIEVQAPLKLRVGNAKATRVQWRGADVDLMAFAKGEVARLELN